MRLTPRWKSIATSAGLALAFAAAVAMGAFAIVAGLTPAATTAPPPREALLIESAPSQAPLSLEPARAQSPARAAKPPVREPPTREPAAARPAEPPRPVAALEPQETMAQETVARPDEAPVAPPTRPADPPRRTGSRGEMAALPAEPPVAPAPLRRAAPDQPRLVHAPVLRPKADPRMEGVLTPEEIRRIRNALRLTAEQTPHWPPVEALLQEIGAQQIALVKAGQKAEDAFGGGLSMRIYWAARPLLGVLREDQKARIRARAKALGLDAVASAI